MLNTADKAKLTKILTEGVGAMAQQVEESGTCYLCDDWESFLVDSMVSFLSGMTAGYECADNRTN